MKKRIVFGTLSLLLSILIAVSCFGTGSMYGEAGGRIGNWINDHLLFHVLTAVEVRAMTAFGAKFIGHFTLFALDGLFAYLFFCTFKKRAVLRVVVFVLFGAALSALGETIQMFVEGRYPSFADVLLNYGAYLFVPSFAALGKRLIG